MIHTTFLLGLALFGQEAVFRAESRLALVDVLVSDTARQRSIADLTAERFEVKIDGRKREISHFAVGDTKRRPLAMLVFFNLAPDGGMRELSKSAAAESFRAAMKGLQPEDEVAVHAIRDWFAGTPEEVVALTKDHGAAAEALSQAITAAPEQQESRGSRDRIMTAAIEKARQVAAARPDSLVALVYISDGINALDAMSTRDRRALQAMLDEESSISVSALNVQMMREYAAAAAVLNPLGVMMGYRVTGTAAWLAEQTGGVTVDLNSPGELAAGFGRILSAYASRYTLGIRLNENELRDGKRHRVEVKVQGIGAKQLSYRKGLAGAAD